LRVCSETVDWHSTSAAHVGVPSTVSVHIVQGGHRTLRHGWVRHSPVAGAQLAQVFPTQRSTRQEPVAGSQ
jgi:hypothetical protein